MRQKREIEIRRDTLKEISGCFDETEEYNSARLVWEKALELDWVLEEEVPQGEINKEKQK